MDALVMCGGRGTRLDADAEKPLFDVGGRPMVDYVTDALDASAVGTTHAVTSPHAPATHERLRGRYPIVDAPGESYVADLQTAVERVGTPVLTVAADLPLLESEVVDRVLAAADGSTSVRVPAVLKRLLGASVDGDGAWVATGLNVVADDGDVAIRSYDARLAVNVNRRSDAAVAERLLSAERGRPADGRGRGHDPDCDSEPGGSDGS